MDDRTVATYEAFAAAYDRETAGFWEDFPADFIDQFAGMVGGNRAVLDIGSGPGRDAELLRERELDLTCLDAAPAMLAMTEAKGFRSVQGDLLSLPFPDASFDGVWAYTSLLHVRRDELPAAVAEIARVLRPGGALALGMIEGEGENAARSTDLVSQPRLFTYVTEDELRGLRGGAFQEITVSAMQPNRRRYLNVLAQKRR